MYLNDRTLCIRGAPPPSGTTNYLIVLKPLLGLVLIHHNSSATCIIAGDQSLVKFYVNPTRTRINIGIMLLHIFILPIILLFKIPSVFKSGFLWNETFCIKPRVVSTTELH